VYVDCLPDGTLDLTWTADGPGTVTFSYSADTDTTATFETAGTYTLTLTADDGDLTGSDTHTITVEEEPPSTVIDRASPVVTVVSPAAGAVYEQGATVLADYSCRDDGSGIVSCDAPVADGSPLDTTTPGSFQFTVTGIDAAGNTATATRSYEVVALCDGKPVTLFVPPGGGLVEGTPGDDVILGTAGPDWISGRGGNDTICGLGGDDLLLGGPGDDTLEGGEGNDRLRGAAGDDILRGDGGSDRLLPEAGDDIVDGGAGSDIVDYLAATGPITLDLGAGSARYFPATGGSWFHRLVLVEKVDGSPFDDTLVGDGNRNVLRGKHGADTILGGNGDDVLIGGLGDDRIQGGAGADLVKGQGGDDTLSGGDGDDRLVGGSGDDTLEGGSGDDTLIGGLKRHLGVFADSLDGGGGFDACRWDTFTRNCP
jgi:Ca2+-binding RTX toxin-like protein